LKSERIQENPKTPPTLPAGSEKSEAVSSKPEAPHKRFPKDGEIQDTV